MSFFASRTPNRIWAFSADSPKLTVAGSRIGRLNATSTANAGGSSGSARPGSGPWSTCRGRSPTGSRTAAPSAGARGSGSGRRRPTRSGDRGRRAGSRSRSWGDPRRTAARSGSRARRRESNRGGGWSTPPPRRARRRRAPRCGSRTGCRGDGARAGRSRPRATGSRWRRSAGAGRCDWRCGPARWPRTGSFRRSSAPDGAGTPACADRWPGACRRRRIRTPGRRRPAVSGRSRRPSGSA